jgi:chromosome segregation ATPase
MAQQPEEGLEEGISKVARIVRADQIRAAQVKVIRKQDIQKIIEETIQQLGQAENRELLAKIAGQEVKLQSVLSAKSSVEAQLLEANQSILRSAVEMETLRSEIKKREEELKQSHAESQPAREALSGEKEKSQALAAKLQSANDAKAALEKQLTDSQAQIQSLSKKLEATQAQISRASSSLSASAEDTRRMRASDAAQIASLTEKVSSLERELTRKGSERDSLALEMEMLSNKLRTSEEQLSDEKMISMRLSEDFQKLEDERDLERENLRTEISARDAAVKEVERKIETLSLVNEMLSKEGEKVRADSEAAQEKLNSLLQQAKEKHLEEVTKLSQEMEALRDRLSLSEQEREALYTKSSSLEDSLRHREERLKTLDGQVTALEAELRDAKEKEKESLSLLEQVQLKSAETIETLKSQIRELTETVERRTAEQKALIEKNSSLDSELVALQQTVREAEVSRQEREGKFKQEMDRISSDYDARARILEEKMLSLQLALFEANKENEALKQSINSLQDDLANTKRESEAALNQRAEEISSLKGALRAAEITRSDLTKSVKSLQEEIARNEKEHSEQIQKLNKEMEKLRAGFDFADILPLIDFSIPVSKAQELVLAFSKGSNRIPEEAAKLLSAWARRTQTEIERAGENYRSLLSKVDSNEADIAVITELLWTRRLLESLSRQVDSLYALLATLSATQ